ncbi:glycolate oxidase subunit GlcF [Neisseria shayeganii]|uniref:Glycolate oxidase iron-sulfur subunit n=1 Tax=Neisseria shayeganii TaxID=607712 RepID=A0A7D7NC76_9NEIS|nr:glycolate oxidase subunit GlcF [Neisseria shayeganii]QMT40758.1 glycolate oxidase subunit GlcF [Neisseria shayeganii]
MQTNLPEPLLRTEAGKLADTILRKCVHCGFCTATCPTYQVTGSELDSPRGRIYQIKQVLEGAPATKAIQHHLDRCLTCRNCETTCPSGVHYTRLLDIGREVVEEAVGRSPWETVRRQTLRHLVLTKPLFHHSYRLAQRVHGLLPRTLRGKILPPQQPLQSEAVPANAVHSRKVIIPAGCVQPTMMPNIDEATYRVLHKLGIQCLTPTNGGCCGAVNLHLNEHEKSLADMRRNIDAWWPHIEAGAEAILSNTSGCGVMIKDYAFHLKEDPQYAEKAKKVSELTKDLVEIILPQTEQLSAAARPSNGEILAYHPPCTLQHGQKIRGQVEQVLSNLGYQVLLPQDSHLCCGSAGTYSFFHPDISKQLRDNKLRHLSDLKPAAILSANIGCLTHLAGGTDLPVRHWIEFVAEQLQ